MIPIQRIELPVPGIEILHSEAREEGYDFIETLVGRMVYPKNRFDAQGETLCGYLDQGLLVAVGGLNCDPSAGFILHMDASVACTCGLHGETRALAERG